MWSPPSVLGTSDARCGRSAYPKRTRLRSRYVRRPVRALGAPRTAVLVAVSVALAAAGCTPPRPSPAGRSGRGRTGGRRRHGRRCDLAGRRRERVRLLGIDTPETVKPNTPVQCYGPEASAPHQAPAAAGHPRARRRATPRRVTTTAGCCSTSAARTTACSSTWPWSAAGFARPSPIAPNTAHASRRSRSRPGEARAAAPRPVEPPAARSRR